MVSLTVIKNWFKTGLKPTQAQFWDTWDSFWHKDQQIPLASIEGMQEVLDDKLDVDLYVKPFPTQVIDGNVFLWFPKASNTTGLPEQYDPATGRIENRKLYLQYNTGNPALLESWTILKEQKLY